MTGLGTTCNLNIKHDFLSRGFQVLWIVVFIVSELGVVKAKGQVWPGRDWLTTSPESQGMASQGLDRVEAYAQESGGVSGCVIRHGRLVKEWGPVDQRADIKSATKGSFGTTVLGLALDRGLLKIDDIARSHDADLGRQPAQNLDRPWLGEITLENLATMTAGFDDGRPPLLVYRPGTRGVYSNDTSNMLAEILTLKFGEDLADVMRREVLEPIGIKASDYAWRENQYRSKTIRGLRSREFASGITINHRALARLGYLYLNGGEWDGRPLLSRKFVERATTPTSLPAPWPYYAYYWGSNARGTFAQTPKDTCWALGLGDSMLAVCPSLDLVVVRLGRGTKASQLPGPDEDWGLRVATFLRLVVDAVRDPYPRSPIIRGISWDAVAEVIRQAQGSDNWPMTHADDDHLYTAYGDGRGFEPRVPEKLSLGLARVSGLPPNIQGENLHAPTLEQKGEGRAGLKASGLLMVRGTLYLWARNAGNAKLAWSDDRGVTWSWCDWRFRESFGCPTFVNFGRNYENARDGHVYIISHDGDSAYQAADHMVLARVPVEALRDHDAYEFFAGVNAQNHPTWTADIAKREAVFKHTGRCYRSTMSYNEGLKRYLWCQTLPGDDPRQRGGFGIFDAPEPWGPWTTVFYTEDWDIGPGETSGFPTKWMSADGRTLWLVFSGDDAFSCVERRYSSRLVEVKRDGGYRSEEVLRRPRTLSGKRAV